MHVGSIVELSDFVRSRAATGNAMFHPPHPGVIIKEVCLAEFKISGRALATALDVAASTVTRLVNGTSRVTPAMALRLSTVLGRSAESWLAMQDDYDLWHARQRLDLSHLTKLP